MRPPRVEASSDDPATALRRSTLCRARCYPNRAVEPGSTRTTVRPRNPRLDLVAGTRIEATLTPTIDTNQVGCHDPSLRGATTISAGRRPHETTVRHLLNSGSGVGSCQTGRKLPLQDGRRAIRPLNNCARHWPIPRDQFDYAISSPTEQEVDLGADAIHGGRQVPTTAHSPSLSSRQRS